MSAESGSDETYRERRDKVTVNGYIRHYFMNQNNSVDIPQDIINLCFLFYHIIFQDTFKHFNPDNYAISNDGRTLTNKGSFVWSTCYASYCISSLGKCIYSWKFKILQRQSFIAIGIDETKYERKHSGHWDLNEANHNSKYYVIWNNQKLNKWDDNTLMEAGQDAPIFETNDTLIMRLNLFHRKLSFQKNADKEYIAFTDITVGDDLEYCMAIYACNAGDSVELLSCDAQQSSN